jgi:hypothetical protein
MLRRSSAFALAVAMAVAVALLPSRPAAANDPECDGYYNEYGQCVTTVRDPGSGTPGTPGDPGVPGGVVECPDAPDAQCSDGLGGWWDQGKRCYVSVLSRAPDQVPPAMMQPGFLVYIGYIRDLWSLHPDGDGVILGCKFSDGGWPLPFWWGPSGDPVPSGPEFEAAVEASIIVDLRAPGLGVFPGGLEDPAYPDASGAVGMPVWLWADDPGPGVASKLVKNTELRGHNIRIKVSLSKVVYDMGNGDTVTCGLGTEPFRVRAPRPSPTCPYSYMEKGRYTVSADTVFNVEWSSGSRQGVFPFTLTRSGVYNVAEIQVVAVPGP